MKSMKRVLAFLGSGFFMLQVGGCPITDMLGGVLGG